MNQETGFDELVTQRYYDSFGDVYEAVWNEQIHTGMFNNTAEKSLSQAVEDMNGYIAKKAGIREGFLLNVGCGRGGTDRFLAKSYQVRVAGIDISKSQIAQARKRAEAERLNQKIAYAQGSMTQIPYSDNTFDYLWVQESFFHCHDKVSAAKEFSRVLKPAGRLILEDTVIVDENAKEEVLKKFGQRVKVNDIFTPAECRTLFSGHGFTLTSEEDISKNLAKTYEMIIQFIQNHKEKLEKVIPAEYQERLSQSFGFPNSLQLVQEKKLGCVLMIFDKI
jgi:ubiquinone/menaquinone biosynthesis C-methylase UbiE